MTVTLCELQLGFPCDPTRLAGARIGANMRDWKELLDLARLCFRQAHITSDPATADKFDVMAREYFARAKALNPQLREDDLTAA